MRKRSLIFRYSSAVMFLLAFRLCFGQLHASDSDAVVGPKFSQDVLPILRSNCIACHNIKQAEGGLNLESVSAILAGGDSGSMVSVAEPGSSMLLARARGEMGDIMPPADNAVGAKQLTEAELSIVQQWIAGGAKDDALIVSSLESNKSKWQPLPANLRSVYALAASPTESIVAVGRGNTIAIVDANSGAIQDQLVDQNLAQDFGIEAADLDFVNALAFSPYGDRLVSGGYRTLKVWRRAAGVKDLGDLESLVSALIKQSLSGQANGVTDQQRQQVSEWIKSSELRAGKSVDELERMRWRDNLRRQTEHSEFLKGLIGPATERVTKEEEASKKADEAQVKKAEELNEKKKGVDEAAAKVEGLKVADPPASEEQKVAAEKELETAKTGFATTEKELAAVAQAAASAKDVHQRAIDSLNDLNAEVGLNGKELEQLQQAIEQRTASIEQKSVLAIGYNADQTLAAAAISDGTVIVLDCVNGRAIRRLVAAPSGITGFIFVDQWLVGIGANGAEGSQAEGGSAGSEPNGRQTLAVWNLETTWELERVIGSPDGPSPFVDRITALEYSPDGKWLIVGGGEPSRTGVLQVLDTQDYSIKSTWDRNHSDIVLSVKVSPDSKRLATSGADKQIRVVDFPSGENMRSLEGHTHHVLGIAWQDHGRRLASVSGDRTVKVWNVRAGEAERTINAGGKEVSGVAFVGLTAQIAVASGEGAVRLYNTDNGGQIRAFNQVRGFQQAVTADPAGLWIAAGSTDGGFRVWPVEAVEPRVVLD